MAIMVWRSCCCETMPGFTVRYSRMKCARVTRRRRTGGPLNRKGGADRQATSLFLFRPQRLDGAETCRPTRGQPARHECHREERQGRREKDARVARTDVVQQ